MIVSYVFNSSLAVTATLASILVVIAYFYWRSYRNNHYWKLKNVPAETPFPLIGSFIGLLKGKKTIFDLDDEMYKKHGRIYGSYLFGSPMLNVSEPELLRQVLVKDFHKFADRRDFPTEGKILSNFISVLRGEDWHRVRAVITPAFSTGKLKKMVNLIMDCGETLRNNYQKYVDSGEFVDCKRIYGGYTLDVIASAAFGTKLNSHEDPDNIFVQKVKRIFTRDFDWRFVLFIISPKLCKQLGVSIFDNEVTDFFADLSLSIVDRRKKNNEIRDDFLNNLIEAQKQNQDLGSLKEDNKSSLHKAIVESEDTNEDENDSYFKKYQKNKTISEDELVAQCVIFFVVGYDTTATTLSMVTYYLAQNHECQKKLAEEVDAVWKKHIVIDAEALGDMKYADAVISETLRLTPPAGRLERRALEDYELGDTGITIPKDMVVSVPIYPMQRDPEFFPDPETFNPDRFLPENKDLIQPYTYLPFGAGPRNCLGMRMALMEIKLALLKVYKDFTFDVCSQTKCPLEIPKASGLYSPKDVTLKITRRNQD